MAFLSTQTIIVQGTHLDCLWCRQACGNFGLCNRSDGLRSRPPPLAAALGAAQTPTTNATHPRAVVVGRLGRAGQHRDDGARARGGPPECHGGPRGAARLRELRLRGHPAELHEPAPRRLAERRAPAAERQRRRGARALRAPRLAADGGRRRAAHGRGRGGPGPGAAGRGLRGLRPRDGRRRPPRVARRPGRRDGARGPAVAEQSGRVQRRLRGPGPRRRRGALRRGGAEARLRALGAPEPGQPRGRVAVARLRLRGRARGQVRRRGGAAAREGVGPVRGAPAGLRARGGAVQDARAARVRAARPAGAVRDPRRGPRRELRGGALRRERDARRAPRPGRALVRPERRGLGARGRAELCGNRPPVWDVPTKL